MGDPEIPLDMLVVNALIVIKLYAAIMKQGYDKSLRREVENVRIARFTTHNTGLACCISISMLYTLFKGRAAG